MNFGKIAKAHAFAVGFTTPFTEETLQPYMDEGKNASPGRLEKANNMLDKLREQMEKRWKLDEGKKKKGKKTR